jgi:hypothetical protein
MPAPYGGAGHGFYRARRVNSVRYYSEYSHPPRDAASWIAANVVGTIGPVHGAITSSKGHDSQTWESWPPALGLVRLDHFVV